MAPVYNNGHELAPGTWSFMQYSDTTWFDKNWMFVGPFVGVLLILYATLYKQYKIGSVGWFGWFAVFMYTTHQFEEHGYNIYGQRYTFVDFIAGNDVMPVSPRRITYINVIDCWTLMAIGALYFDYTGNPMVIFMAYVLSFTQLSHVLWIFMFGGYNPGCLQTLFMLPLVGYVMRKIYSEFYADVFFPKLIVAQVPFFTFIMAPWFTMEVSPGDYYLLATQVWACMIYPVLFAKYIWPALCGKPKNAGMV